VSSPSNYSITAGPGVVALAVRSNREPHEHDRRPAGRTVQVEAPAEGIDAIGQA
jgi:hypothetical protein